MGRLPGFDYRKPFFYMVTLKRHQGLADFSALGRENGQLAPNAITQAFIKVIRGFPQKWRGIAPIETFVIMPDHLHLLLRICDHPERLSLGRYVYQLEKALALAYWQTMGGSEPTVRLGPNADGGSGFWWDPMGDRVERCEPTGRLVPDSAHDSTECGKARTVEPVFEHDWHDWIVMKDGQLKAFTRYIRENPYRAWLRRKNRQYFGQVRKVEFAGREWFAYGNTALLELPVIAPFRCSRKWAQGGPEWCEALGQAERIGPGGAGIGTFMSPCEKACGNAIFKAGGALIVLHPEGFGERWHPTRNKEALCAQGKMLFLSLWEPSAAKPDNATLYRRCHEMGDLLHPLGLSS